MYHAQNTTQTANALAGARIGGYDEPSRVQTSADRLADAGDAVTDLVNGIARLLSAVSPRPETTSDTKGPRPVPTLGGMLEMLPKHIGHEAERGHALLNELRTTLGL